MAKLKPVKTVPFLQIQLLAYFTYGNSLYRKVGRTTAARPGHMFAEEFAPDTRVEPASPAPADHFEVLTPFNELADGTYFVWKGERYRKIVGGKAERQRDMKVLDFGLGNKVAVSDNRGMGYVTQYLHWALIAAHALEDPSAEVVTIKLDLVRRQATTSSR